VTALDEPWGEWRPDPFDRYPWRHFFLGRPTSIVRTGDVEGYDPVSALLPLADVPDVAPGEPGPRPPGARPLATAIPAPSASAALDDTEPTVAHELWAIDVTDAARAAPAWPPLLRGIERRVRHLHPAAIAVVIGVGAIGVSLLAATVLGALTDGGPVNAALPPLHVPDATHLPAATTVPIGTVPTPTVAVAPTTAPTTTVPVTTTTSVTSTTKAPAVSSSPPATPTTTQMACPSGAPESGVSMTAQPAAGASQWTVTITGSATNATSATINFQYASVQITDSEGNVLTTVQVMPTSGGTVTLAPSQSTGLSYSGTVQSPDAPRVGTVTVAWQWADAANASCPT